MLRIPVLIALIATGVAAADDVPSRIEAVTVYPSGALVTRVARVELAAGINSVRLTGLVSDLNTEVLQIIPGDSEVQISQVRLSVEQNRNTLNREVAALEAAISDKSSAIQSINDSTEAAQLRLKFLDSLTQGNTGQAMTGGSFQVSELRAVLGLLQSESEDARRLLRDNQQRSKPLLEDLSQLQRQLATLRGKGLQSSAVSMDLVTPRAISMELRILYFQEEAEWRPSYVVRLDSDSGQLDLAQQAEVLQATDESWEGVRLSLSSSEPTGDLEAPSVRPEFINIFRPQQAALASRLKRNSGMQAESLRVQNQERVEEIVVTGSRVTVGNFSVSYDIPGLSTISNTADEAVTLDLSRFDFQTDLVSVAVPRQSSEAFLEARFTYEEATPLFGNDAQLFVDGVYAGVSTLPTMMPDSEVTLPMGQDRRVVVSAKPQGGQDRASGILKKRQQETTDFLFEITSRHAKPTTIEVRDRLPISRNAAIEVEVPRSATRFDEQDIDDQPGLVLWRKTLDQGETFTIRHQYSVSYPQDTRIVRE